MYTTEEIRAVRTRAKLRDHERLRETLVVINQEGWEGAPPAPCLSSSARTWCVHWSSARYGGWFSGLGGITIGSAPGERVESR